MSSGCRNLHGALGKLLTAHIGKVYIRHGTLRQIASVFGCRGLHGCVTVKMRNKLRHRLDAVHTDALHRCRLAHIGVRHIDLSKAPILGGTAHTKHTANGPQLARKGKLADHTAARNVRLPTDIPAVAQNAHKNG
jgi:uncharacterized protein (UPF0179 family)